MKDKLMKIAYNLKDIFDNIKLNNIVNNLINWIIS